MALWRGRLGLLAIALFFAAFGCFPLRRPSRTSITAAGAYSRAEHQTFDCDADPIQRHHQYGGAVEVRHETRFGLNAGGRGLLLAGELDEHVDFTPMPDQSPYYVPGLGGFAGYDFPFFGAEGGLTLLAHVAAPENRTPWFLLPYGRVRVGDYDLMSFEAQLGSRTALAFDTRLIAIGAAFRQSWIDLHAGVGFGGRLMIDQEGGGFIIGARDALDFTIYLEGQLEVIDRFWITFGGQVGQQWPTAMLGLRYDVAWDE